MKNESNKIALVILLVFVFLPAISYTVNSILSERFNRRISPVLKRISDNDIHVLEITGKKASERMLYAQNAWKTLNVVNLNIMIDKIEVKDNILSIDLKDESNVYQGSIILANLKSVVRNGNVTELKEH